MARKKWTDEALQAEANKFPSKGAMMRGSNSAYQTAYRVGILDRIFANHENAGNFERKGKALSPTKWTKELCLRLARDCKTRKEFSVKHPGAWSAVQWRGWGGEAFSHMNTLGNRANRFVYIIANEKSRTIYVGITCQPTKRMANHTKNSSDAIRAVMASGSITVSNKTVSECRAVAIEIYLIQRYSRNGWNVLNQAAGPRLGNTAKWTRSNVAALICDCDSRKQFRTKHPDAYKAALRFGHDFINDAFRKHRHMGFYSDAHMRRAKLYG